jgi:hypothetical protein
VNSTYMSSLFGPLDILCSFLAQEWSGMTIF